MIGAVKTTWKRKTIVLIRGQFSPEGRAGAFEQVDVSMYKNYVSPLYQVI